MGDEINQIKGQLKEEMMAEWNMTNAKLSDVEEEMRKLNTKLLERDQEIATLKSTIENMTPIKDQEIATLNSTIEKMTPIKGYPQLICIFQDDHLMYRMFIMSIFINF